MASSLPTNVAASASQVSAPTSDARGQRPPIGLEGFVEHAVDRIRRHLADGQAREAFVIGVFGEWGSGKSTMLSEIRSRFPLPPLTPRLDVTLPVDFNAWRYERDEHLLIPLLRTVERTLASFLKDVEAKDRESTPALKRWVRGLRKGDGWSWLAQRAALLGACIIALTRMVKLKAAVPLLGEVELAPYDALQAVQEQVDRAERKPEAGPQPFQSLYYDLRNRLEELTRGKGGVDDPRLSFVFLVDDLDRCLPEKAVEMLESIKLFLDIPGCAFVLALDDEVVERGIAHRYRDYLDLTDRAAESIAYSLRPERYQEYLNRFADHRLPPITGHEYLEKIVQLPIRLPRLSREQVTELLNSIAPELLLPSAPTPKSPPSTWFVDLFLQAVPPVPRKVIRAVELLRFVRGLAEHAGVVEQLHPYTLAQLVLLQLFAPQTFRYLARRGRAESWNHLDRRIASAAKSRASGLLGPSFFNWWDKEIAREREQEAAVTALERYEEPFVPELRQAATDRSGFDPRNLFLPLLSVDDDLARYFNFLAAHPAAVGGAGAGPAAATSPGAAEAAPARRGPPAGEVSAPPPRTVGGTPVRAVPIPSAPRAESVGAAGVRPPPEPAAPRELEPFIDLLLAPHRDSWRGAFNNEPGLWGRVLDAPTFQRLVRAVVDRPEVVSAPWLEVVAPALTDAQLDELLGRSGALSRLHDAGTPEAVQALGRLLEVYCWRSRPWPLPYPMPIDGRSMGVRPGSFREREWGYLYLRGLRVDPIAGDEPLAVWPGYETTIGERATFVRELAPGLVAIGTGWEVALFTRAFRRQWMKVETILANPGTLDLEVLDPFHVVTHDGLRVQVWRRDGFFGWDHGFTEPILGSVSQLTVLAPDCFVCRIGENSIVAWLRPGDAIEWTRIDFSSAPPGDLARLGARRFASLVPAGPATELEIDDTARSIRASETSSLSGAGSGALLEGVAPRLPEAGADAPAASLADGAGEAVGRVLVTVGPGSALKTWAERGGAWSETGSVGLGIPSGRIVSSNGTRVAVVAGSAVEIWDLGNPSAPALWARQDLGGLDRETAPSIALLSDGTVVHASASSVAAYSPVGPDRALEYTETLALVAPSSSPADGVDPDHIVLSSRDGVYRSSSDAGRQDRIEAQPIVPLAIRALPGEEPGYATIDGSPRVHLSEEGETRSIDLPAVSGTLALGGAGNRLWVASPRAAVELSRSGTPPPGVSKPPWVVARSVSLDFDPTGITADAFGNAVAWNEGGDLAAITPEVKDQPRRVGLRGTWLSSVVAVPEGWRRGGDGRFLICLDGRAEVLSAPSGSTEGSPPFTDLRLAAPLREDRLLVVLWSGGMEVWSPTATLGAMHAIVHGLPDRIELLRDGISVLVHAHDDAWYSMSFPPDAPPRVTRLLLAAGMLIEQQIDPESGDITSARYRVLESGRPDQPTRLERIHAPIDPVRWIPCGAAALRWIALMRANGELAEPGWRREALSWEDERDATARGLVIRGEPVRKLAQLAPAA